MTLAAAVHGAVGSWLRPEPVGRVVQLAGTLVHIVPVRLGYGFFGLGRPRA